MNNSYNGRCAAIFKELQCGYDQGITMHRSMYVERFKTRGM